MKTGMETLFARGCLSALYAAVIGVMACMLIHTAYAVDGDNTDNTDNTENPAPRTGLLITWTAPKALEDGTPLSLDEITGYDIYYSLNGAKQAYLAWVSNLPPRTRYQHETLDIGRHCYWMRTVTENYGKSKLSAVACADLTAPPSPPLPPEAINVTDKQGAL